MTRHVKPIGHKRLALGASAGGPLFQRLGWPTPLPQILVFGQYGLGPKSNVDLGFYLPIVKTLGIDSSIAHQILKQQGLAPTLMLSTGLLCFIGLSANKQLLFEQLTLTASWQARSNLTAYTALHSLFRLEDSLFRPQLSLGVLVDINPRWQLACEIALTAFNEKSDFLALNYLRSGSQGTWSVFLGFKYFLPDLHWHTFPSKTQINLVKPQQLPITPNLKIF